MAQYTYAQLEGLWISAGGSAATAPVAAAIAEAESGGNSAVTSSNPDGGTNVGLWQLDTKGVGSGFSVTQLQDPAANASITVNGSAGGTNWASWETFVNGAYKAFLSASTTPDNTGLPAGGTTVTAATVTAAATAASACLISTPSVNVLVTTLGGGCLFTRSQARALIGGLMLTAAGIIGLAAAVIIAVGTLEKTGAASAVTQAAGNLAPVGKVVSVAARAAPKRATSGG